MIVNNKKMIENLNKKFIKKSDIYTLPFYTNTNPTNAPVPMQSLQSYKALNINLLALSIA